MLLAPTSAFIQLYWMVLVSWNSSTSTWPKRAAVVLDESRGVLPQLVAAQQQLGEIDHAVTPAGFLVRLVQLDHLADGSGRRRP
jgi:hypothetical protein